MSAGSLQGKAQEGEEGPVIGMQCDRGAAPL